MPLYLSVILALFFVNGNIFFFSKLIPFTACSRREQKSFFIKSSLHYKLHLFSMLSKSHIGEIEYPQGVCSLFFCESFFPDCLCFYLFSNQRFKVSISNVWHFIWLYIFIKKYYINLLGWHYDSTIPYFFIRFKLVLLEWRRFRQNEIPLCFEFISFNHADSFFTGR